MPLQLSARPLPELVPEQEFLSLYVRTVIGPIEFRVWKKQLERISDLLGLSGVEQLFQRLSLRRRDEDEQRTAEKENRLFRPLSSGEQVAHQRLSSQALRCNVAQTLMGEDFQCAFKFLTRRGPRSIEPETCGRCQRGGITLNRLRRQAIGARVESALVDIYLVPLCPISRMTSAAAMY